MSDWFNIDVDPTGHILESVLILKGQYCRVSNIDNDHKFIRDETFWVGDQQIVRKAGQSAGNLAYSLIELRKKSQRSS